MSGYSPMGKSDKFNNLAFAYSPIPSSISLGLGNKKNNPERNIQSGFFSPRTLVRGSHPMRGICCYDKRHTNHETLSGG